MSEISSPMLERLEEFLAKNPKDSFVRYGLSMELAKLGRTDEAIQNFLGLIAADPSYIPAYYQAGMVLVRCSQKEEAREVFLRGINAAASKGDSHALSELQAALAETDN